MAPILAVQHLSVNFGPTYALQDVSFSVESGAYVGVVGPNGSGKTTLLRSLLGFINPAKGSIDLFGTPNTQFKDWARIGYLPQTAGGQHAYFPATVAEVVSLGLVCTTHRGALSEKETKAVQRALEALSIADIQDASINGLSGGQRQRVFLARALVNQPDLLILDEPSTALDPAVREDFFALLKRLNEKQQMTILLVTHDVGTIGQHARQLLYIDKHVVFFGGFGDFCGSPQMTEYFGSHAQHLICHQHRGPAPVPETLPLFDGEAPPPEVSQ